MNAVLKDFLIPLSWYLSLFSFQRYSVEMSIRDLKKTELLSKVEALKKGGVLLPNDLLEKVDSINEKWERLGVFAFLLLFVGYVYIFCVVKYSICLISNLRHKYLSLSIHYLHFKQAIHAIMGENTAFPLLLIFFLFTLSLSPLRF